MSVVETFAVECQAEQLPPTVVEMDALLKHALPQASQILQWAIVKTDPDSARLWVEGSYFSA